MTNVIQDGVTFKFSCVCFTEFLEIFEIIEENLGQMNIADIVIWTSGTLCLAWWLLNTSLGKRALDETPQRRNNMPAYLPFVPLLVLICVISIATAISEKLYPDLGDWQEAFVSNIIMCLGAISCSITVLLLARKSFARGLKGFGIDFRTLFKDFGGAFVNLLSVWPVFVAMLLVTIFLGKLFYGSDFHITQHEELELISTHTQTPVRILIFITAVVIVPIAEELFFRGIIQTTLRSFLKRPWVSIMITSSVFAVVHANPEHWASLFVISVCMGYAYEKSGSLLRSIFVHSLFNAISILAALLQ
ncbi:lysostaphin resistance A-like protein [Planctomycetota bacterium]